jgi:hypothetical protein
MKINNFPERLEILKAGINRFFNDGLYQWDAKAAQGVLMAMWPEEIDPRDPIVIEKLKEWERLGVIKFVGTDECFFRVLKKFEREPDEPRIV